MKRIVLIFGLFLVSLTIQAYGQSLSELDKQLKEENEKKAQEIQASQQLQQGSFEKVDCPQGTHERAISGGDIICVDDVTGQEVKPEDYWSYQLGGQGSTFAIGIGIIIVIIIVAVAFSRKGRPAFVERRGFSLYAKETVLRRQNHRCNNCHKLLDVVDYDHVDGDRSNNDVSNCHALCPNCHAKKSRREQMGVDD